MKSSLQLCGTEQVTVTVTACASVCSAQNVAFVPAVFENEQDVIPESVSVLFQDPTDII